MKQLIIALALLLPVASFAGSDHNGRAAHLAKALNLNEADAARLEKAIAPYQAQVVPLKAEIRSQREILQKAGAGDSAAASQVDQAVQKISTDRSQLASLNQQIFQAASAGMTSEQKAKLAIAMTGKHGRHQRRGR